MAIVSISGLHEAHLTIADLNRSIASCRNVLGLPLAHTAPSRHAAFYLDRRAGGSHAGVMVDPFLPMFMRLRIAFRVTLPTLKHRSRRYATPA